MSLTATNSRRYLRHSAAASLVNSGISALATAVLLPWVIRAIGMDAYGLWAILGVFIGIAAALDLGVWKALVFLLPRKEFSDEQLLGSALTLCLATALGFGLLMMLLIALHVPIFGAAVAEHPGLTAWLATAGTVIVLCSLLTNLLRGALESAYRGYAVNLGYALLTLLLYAVPSIIVRWTHDPRALIAGSVAVYVVVMLLHWFYIQKVRSMRMALPARNATGALLRYGLRSFGADAPSILLGPALLYSFVLLSSDSAQFGVFEIALKIATLAATTLGMLSTPFFALVAGAKTEDKNHVRDMLSKYLRITIPLALLGWTTYLLVGQPLLAWLFDTNDDTLFKTSLVMLAGTAAAAALEPIARMQMGLARLGRLFWVRAAMFAVALLGVLVFSQWPILDRYAAATAMGFAAAACGLLWINRVERWGIAA